MSVWRGVVLGVLLVAGVAGMFSRWADVFVDDAVAFLDPDCYSRMARVAMVLRGEALSIRAHAFENAPHGIQPHTTAPLDLVIAAPSAMLGWFGMAPDQVGAFVSPALGLVFLVLAVLFLFRRAYGLAGLALLTLSPIVAHTFAVGRPDHQSLLAVLLLAALGVELDLWRSGRFRPVCAGVVWGLACWVSLFEPAVLLVACIVLRVVAVGRAALPGDRAGWMGLVAFAVVFGGAVVIDGWRVHPLSAEVVDAFPRWAAAIGELQPAGWGGVFAWIGWVAPVAPLALLVRGRAGIAEVGLFSLLLALTLGAARWGPFLVVAAALVVPRALDALPASRSAMRGLAAWVFAFSLWPMAAAWDQQIFPEGEAAQRRIEARTEAVLLREVCRAVDPAAGTIVAPWWTSPAIAYWTGGACIAGSSHQSLPGTLAVSRLFLAGDDREALEILRARRAAWVVADDPARVVASASQVLGVAKPARPLAERLWRGRPPAFLEPVAGNRFFRLYRVRGSTADAPPLPAPQGGS